MNPNQNNVILKTIFLGICFFCLFTTYNLTQGYLTTIFKNQGYIFISLIYFPYSIISLLSSWISKKIGLKTVLLLGSFTYVVWTLCIPFAIYPLIICAALFNGIGAGLLWVHQGVWISILIKSDISYNSIKLNNNNNKNNKNNKNNINNTDNNNVENYRSDRGGTLTGIFFGIYNLSGIIGNIIILILVKYYSLISILQVMSGFTLLTWSFFWFIPYPTWHSWKILWNYADNDDFNIDNDNDNDNDNNDIIYTSCNSTSDSSDNTCSDDTLYHSAESITLNLESGLDSKLLSKNNSLKNHSKRLAMVWKPDTNISSTDTTNITNENSSNTTKNTKFPFLIPIMIQIALLNILSYAINSALAGQSTAPANYDSSFIIAGYFLTYSISSVIFSISWGYIYDWLGWFSVLIIIQLLLLFQLIFITVNITYTTNILQIYYLWWIISLIAGITDTGYNVILNASISTSFNKETVPYIFSWYRFIYCLSTAIFSLSNYFINPVHIMYFIISWSIVTSLSIALFYQFSNPYKD